VHLLGPRRGQGGQGGLYDNKQLQAKNQVNDKLTAVEYFPDKKMILLGPPLRITKDIVNQFNY
jgi:hypothetical protein